MPWWKYAKIGFYIGIILALLPHYLSHAQTTSSVLKEGDWLKVAVVKSGIYRIDRQLLLSSGWPVESIDPRSIQLFGNGGVELPQGNSVSRNQDLLENAIAVHGELDGKFDEEDIVLFYGQGPELISASQNPHILNVKKHTYTDTSFYYLTYGQTIGKRIEEAQSKEELEEESIATYIDIYHHELDQTNLLESGREWWGEYIASRPIGWQVRIEDVVPGSKGYFTNQLLVGASVKTSARWTVNGILIGEQEVEGIPEGRYTLKGRTSLATYNFQEKPLNDLLFFEVTYNAQNKPNAQAYLDFFTLQTERILKFHDQQQSYYFNNSLKDTFRHYQFQNRLQAAGYLWDVTNIREPRLIPFRENRSLTTPISVEQGIQQFQNFTLGNAYIPNLLEKVKNQNIRAVGVPDLLIITATAFREEANRLADLRRSHDLLDVEVVTAQQIYNEFSSGKVDVTALRDYIKHLYDQQPHKLKYVLLFGDASYDYKQIKTSTVLSENLVPSYQSRESLDPLTTYVSDDYYGFLDSLSGEWIESEAGDHLLVIGVGRLPVKNREEARVVVDKHIHYTIAKETKGNWKNKVTFVADDGDGSLHESHAQTLSILAEETLLPKLMFNDAYPSIGSAGLRRIPTLNSDLVRAINEGSAIINFSGHGDASAWTQEQIFTLEEIQKVKGYNNLPLFITATCEFGRFDNPWIVSGAEQLVMSPRGGAIGAITTTRPVYASSNFAMNQAFYRALGTSKRTTRIGDLFKETKNASLKGSLNRNLTLLADPSMQLNIGSQTIRWKEQPDTLRSLTFTTLYGEVLDVAGLAVDSLFNGIAYVEIYDQKSEYTTLGTNSAPSTYLQYGQKMFQGKVSVKSGEFKVNFQTPATIKEGIGLGRVSVYAVTEDGRDDAASQLDILTKGTKTDVSKESNWEISGYLESPTFQNGSTVSSQPTLYLTIQSSSSLDLINQGIRAVLDDSVEINLSDYYWTRIDSSGVGDLQYTFDDLVEGSHQLVIFLTDLYNNIYKQSFSFKVDQSEGIQIEEAVVFPNPFDIEINYKIKHTKPGHDLNVHFTLYNQDGVLLFSKKKSYFNSTEIVNERYYPLTNQQRYPAYIYEIVLESLTDGSKIKKTGWLLHKL